jgi:hypothetical protein
MGHPLAYWNVHVTFESRYKPDQVVQTIAICRMQLTMLQPPTISGSLTAKRSLLADLYRLYLLLWFAFRHAAFAR